MKFTHKHYVMILDYFKGDINKTMGWFHTINPLLGMVKPMDLINIGKAKKLMDFIDKQLAEHRRLY